MHAGEERVDQEFATEIATHISKWGLASQVRGGLEVALVYNVGVASECFRLLPVFYPIFFDCVGILDGGKGLRPKIAPKVGHWNKTIKPPCKGFCKITPQILTS